MRLHDELKALAHAAPAPPSPDELLRRAQAIKHRRAVIAPAMAVMAVVVLAITYLSRVDGGGPIVTVTFGVQQVGEPGATDMMKLRRIVEERAKVAGLRHAHARVQEDWIVLEFDGDGPQVDVQALAAPGDLQMRKVIEALDPPSYDPTASPTPAAASGAEASTLEALITKLTPAVYNLALALNRMGDASFLPGFDTLTAREVALLPLSIQLYVPTIPCSKIVPPAPLPKDERTVICQDGSVKLLLDRATVTGADVVDAMPVENPFNPGLYEVRLRLTQVGELRFANVSSQAATAQGCKQFDGFGHCLLAMVVDGEVVSAPSILRTLHPDEAVIGGTPLAQARLLAAKLGPRQLPSGVKLAG